MKTYIVLFLLILAGFWLSFHVKKLSYWSLGNFGIRKVKRWDVKTDSFSNGMLVISFLFCCGYWLIPYSFLIYSIALIFVTWITMVRVGRLSKKVVKHPSWIAFGFFMAGLCAWYAASQYNGDLLIVLFRKHVLAGISSVLYFLQEEDFAYTLLQGVIMWLPFWFLLNQFKTMRIDCCLRASSEFFCLIKIFVFCFCVMSLSLYGFSFLSEIY